MVRIRISKGKRRGNKKGDAHLFVYVSMAPSMLLLRICRGKNKGSSKTRRVGGRVRRRVLVYIYLDNQPCKGVLELELVLVGTVLTVLRNKCESNAHTANTCFLSLLRSSLHCVLFTMCCKSGVPSVGSSLLFLLLFSNSLLFAKSISRHSPLDHG